MTDSADSPDVGEKTPALRILRGNPSHDELAAVLAVVHSLGGDVDTDSTELSAWNSPSHMHRPPLDVGLSSTTRRAWWQSGLPR